MLQYYQRSGLKALKVKDLLCRVGPLSGQSFYLLSLDSPELISDSETDSVFFKCQISFEPTDVLRVAALYGLF